MATTYDALIIGGGHNGLTCGAYLAKGGLKVLVACRLRPWSVTRAPGSRSWCGCSGSRSSNRRQGQDLEHPAPASAPGLPAGGGLKALVQPVGLKALVSILP